MCEDSLQQLQRKQLEFNRKQRAEDHERRKIATNHVRIQQLGHQQLAMATHARVTAELCRQVPCTAPPDRQVQFFERAACHLNDIMPLLSVPLLTAPAVAMGCVADRQPEGTQMATRCRWGDIDSCSDCPDTPEQTHTVPTPLPPAELWQRDGDDTVIDSALSAGLQHQGGWASDSVATMTLPATPPMGRKCPSGMVSPTAAELGQDQCADEPPAAQHLDFSGTGWSRTPPLQMTSSNCYTMDNGKQDEEAGSEPRVSGLAVADLGLERLGFVSDDSCDENEWNGLLPSSDPHDSEQHAADAPGIPQPLQYSHTGLGHHIWAPVAAEDSAWPAAAGPDDAQAAYSFRRFAPPAGQFSKLARAPLKISAPCSQHAHPDHTLYTCDLPFLACAWPRQPSSSKFVVLGPPKCDVWCLQGIPDRRRPQPRPDGAATRSKDLLHSLCQHLASCTRGNLWAGRDRRCRGSGRSVRLGSRPGQGTPRPRVDLADVHGGVRAHRVPPPPGLRQGYPAARGCWCR